MNEIIHTAGLEGSVEHFFDDLLAHTDGWPEMAIVLEKLFAVVIASGLLLKPSKCEFARREIQYIGFKFTPEGIAAVEDKCEAITKLPHPRNSTEVKSALGMFNYYAHMVSKNYADDLQPLFRLTRKREHFYFDESCKRAWEKLKEFISSTVTLAYPDKGKPMHIFCDAAKLGCGGFVGQEVDGIIRPICFASHIFKPNMINYSAFNKEIYACLWALKRFSFYTYGKQLVTLHTDCSGILPIFRKSKPLSALTERWLCQFVLHGNCQIVHVKSEDNFFADIISRLAPVPATKIVSEEELDALALTPTNLENGTIVFTANEPDAKFVSAIDEPNLPLPTVLGTNRSWDMKREQHDDPYLFDIITYLSTRHLPVNNNTYAEMIKTDGASHILGENGILYKLGKRGLKLLVIPRSLQKTVLYELHNSIWAMHGGQQQVIAKFKELKIYWKNHYDSIKEYVETCEDCQKNKKTHQNELHPEMKILTAVAPCDVYSMDLFGPLTPTEDNMKWVLAVIDNYTRFTWLFALPDSLSTSISDKLLYIFMTAGICRLLVSDNGTNFVSKTITDLCSVFDIRRQMTTVYSPWMNGACERVFRELSKMMRFFSNEDKRHWSRNLIFIQFAMNNKVCSQTKHTPHYLQYGRKSIVPVDRILISPNSAVHRENSDYITDVYSRFGTLCKEVAHNVAKNRRRQADYVNRKATEEILELKPGELVLLKRFRTTGKFPGKFESKYCGPYKLVRVNNDSTATLLVDEEKGNMRVHSLHHIKRYHRRSPSPEVLDNDERPDILPPRRNHKSPDRENLYSDKATEDIYGPDEVDEATISSGPKRKQRVHYEDVSSGPSQNTRIANDFYKLRPRPKRTAFFQDQEY
uniref:RNA-directed DNA polymerase n=1 Tax=Plectus sambesii TaxID=2011161 RepID=A0A914UGS4_9BILA